MKRKIVSVWEVNRYVSHLIEEDYMLNDLWLQGEVSNCKYHHSGHVYFTIKDERAGINAVMFERDAKKLSFRLTEGMKIYARVRITIYEKTGGYQAYVQDIEKQGMGILYERFEALKLKLANEGLFDEKYKRQLPKFPKRVGVITSSTGAAIQDIRQVSNRRCKSIPLYIYPVHVQGEYAVGEIVEAIRMANEEKKVDVIILGRGGGSIEDLWAFNEEAVAWAIFESEIPIVSAVGHEIDFTISDFVSDKRAATPSAAAEIVIPSQEELEARIKRMKENMQYTISECLKNARNQLNYLTSRPIYERKDLFYKSKMQEVDHLMQALNYGFTKKVHESSKAYEIALQKLEKLSPLNTLKRGYALVEDEKGQIVKSVKDARQEEKLKITVADGSFLVNVFSEAVTHKEEVKHG
ncbi:exodeoxyribonuclease VII large subunit [Cellulosilyticum ruminicola]|uniref:exodeoxyribonuclease VII large subunit n=1 Tax=Cellulosilyticum ruminicola TaxID=425254 RepID=UPI0006CF5CE1|nr:exodeoxyribonuclease VII large subunit [Cellulosilyticum ruminicola]